jgi:ATP-dependent DNA helicase DinG
MGPDGALARHVHQYRSRQSQTDMALAVCEAIDKGTNLIVEAGTGVGKTFAYLIPALLSGKQVIVSTGSKNLQDQLFYKDLPALLSMLDVHPRLALLKGRSNYLCQLRLSYALDVAGRSSDKYLDHLLKIDQWASVTKDGDIGNLTTVPERSAAISDVVSTKDSCTGSQCHYYEACFTRKARVKALDAKVIVVNHHLFFADKLLKDTGFTELLPDSDVVIFDEAHQLPDISIRYFGQQLSTHGIKALLKQFIEIAQNELGDTIQIFDHSQVAAQALSAWLNELAEASVSDWRKVLTNKHLSQVSWALFNEFETLARVVEAHLGRNARLDLAFEHLQALIAKLRQFFECQDPQAAYSVEITKGVTSHHAGPSNHPMANNSSASVNPNSRSNPSSMPNHSAVLSIAPINVAKQCQQFFIKDTCWIFTSATLQLSRSLEHFANEMGLSGAGASRKGPTKTNSTNANSIKANSVKAGSASANSGNTGSAKAKQLILDSPFDYPNQAVFCVPRHLAKSGQTQQTAQQLVDICRQAINAAQGRTFVLFTSHQMLQQVAVMLRSRVNYPLLVQGQGSKQHLLEKFSLLGNAVLLGTQSFWEGVDVRGRLLSCVIIDKLPFVQPDDTLYRARAAHAERKGLDPFTHIALPQAVITLKQGVGRLIRDEKDKGVLILCDNRIVNRSYGEAFISSLPPMRRTRDLDKALHFLKRIP